MECPFDDEFVCNKPIQRGIYINTFSGPDGHANTDPCSISVSFRKRVPGLQAKHRLYGLVIQYNI